MGVLRGRERISESERVRESERSERVRENEGGRDERMEGWKDGGMEKKRKMSQLGCGLDWIG